MSHTTKDLAAKAALVRANMPSQFFDFCQACGVRDETVRSGKRDTAALCAGCRKGH
jgi:hypothetical protein